MSSTDLALQSSKSPTDTRVNRIQGKLKATLDVMVWDALELVDACRQTGFSPAAMRNALQRPHVLAYLRNERQVLRASLSPRNLHRLAEIRDAADNMPAVQAIRLLEELGDEQLQRNTGTSHSPGVTIRVINVAAPVQADARQRVIDHPAQTIDHPSQLPDGTGGEKP
jgi:hypothetical protein